MFFTINNTVPVLFGKRVSLQTGQKLRELRVKKVLCVYDRGVKEAGIIDPILKNIRALGIGVVEFDGVLPDPPDTVVDEGGAIGQQEQVDCVLGIGGGSSLDAAKAINILINNQLPFRRYMGLSAQPHKPGVKLVLIPTTSGTGSEVTNISVITDSHSHLKNTCVGRNYTANLAIVDPTLTLKLPASITAATGMDALAHAVEAYTSVAVNPMSDILAEKAIELIVKYLPIAVENGQDLDARTQLAFASTIAGYCFSNALIHVGHGIGHALGTMYHIPHGIGCAIALPGAVESVAEIYPERIKRLSQLLGEPVLDKISSNEQAKIVADSLRSLNKKLSLPTLQEFKIGESDLAAVAEVAVKDISCTFTARKLGTHDILTILKHEYALTS
ncbi:MAG: iron-containing alcohol dehydrogenase [Bacillota bacterium]|nr:iron-containing alcohol dehydrogenase [Bacillota bacterium]